MSKRFFKILTVNGATEIMRFCVISYKIGVPVLVQ